MITRGFAGRPDPGDRVPPGQHVVDDFPGVVDWTHAENRARHVDLHAQGRVETD